MVGWLVRQLIDGLTGWLVGRMGLLVVLFRKQPLSETTAATTAAAVVVASEEQSTHEASEKRSRKRPILFFRWVSTISTPAGDEVPVT